MAPHNVSNQDTTNKVTKAPMKKRMPRAATKSIRIEDVIKDIERSGMPRLAQRLPLIVEKAWKLGWIEGYLTRRGDPNIPQTWDCVLKRKDADSLMSMAMEAWLVRRLDGFSF